MFLMPSESLVLIEISKWGFASEWLRKDSQGWRVMEISRRRWSVEGWIESESRMLQLLSTLFRHTHSFRLSDVIKPSSRATATEENLKAKQLSRASFVSAKEKWKEDTMNIHKIEQAKETKKEDRIISIMAVMALVVIWEIIKIYANASDSLAAISLRVLRTPSRGRLVTHKN
jgi:hypothetical protein